MNTLTRTEHACAIASNLGIRRILIHRFSSLLSAYGISLAEITSEASESLSLTLSAENMPQIEARKQAIKSKLERELRSQDIIGDTIEYEVFLNLQYKGMDTSLSVEKPTDGSDYGSEFTSMHLREFAFTTNREIMVDSIRVRATAKNINQKEGLSVSEELVAAKTSATVPEPKTSQRVFINDQWISTPIYELGDLTIGSHVTGPAIVTDQTQTILIEPGYECHLTSRHLIIDKVETKQESSPSSQLSTETINPVQLSCFANRFMSIAEQMGNTLQRTSISTSIKERLDFSCAIFSPDGGLVANAPHIPIHLGSMQFAIQYQHRLWGDKLKPGDVLLTNHPEAGGTHLPDLTVVTPAFYDNQLIFYVASRGHHTDIGGIGITSMVPDSKELWQEGMAVKSMKIVSEGVFLENEVRDLFNKVAEYPGCSATRRLNDNISDIKAKISANQRGILLIKRLCEEFTLPVVHLYMGGIQRNAELAIKKLFRELYQKTGGNHSKLLTGLMTAPPFKSR